MALYLVAITVRLETYAHTEDEAIRTVERAIWADSRLAAPAPSVPMFGDAWTTINPDRQ
jgi:hypothetical protein